MPVNMIKDLFLKFIGLFFACRITKGVIDGEEKPVCKRKSGGKEKLETA